MKKLVIVFSLFCLLVIVISCEKNFDKREIQGTITETDTTKTSSAIVGINGGTIKFDDKTILKVPEGSLDEDVNIILTRPKSLLIDNQTEREMILLEPEGTIFAKPATLTLLLNDNSASVANSFQAFSCNNGIWEELNILSVDKNTKEIKIEINHFSILLLLKRLDLYLTVDIPGKYLRKGDLIYTLALTEGYDKFYWFPGHAALYLGTNNPGEITNDGQKIIESSPNKVQFSTLDNFIGASYHLYMGARRYIGNISNSQRLQIASFAVNQLNKPYSLVGQNATSNSFSCVGLTEAAYDKSGLSIIPSYLEFPYSLPFDQYKLTKPIDEVTIKIGESVSLNVYGVIWDNCKFR